MEICPSFILHAGLQGGGKDRALCDDVSRGLLLQKGFSGICKAREKSLLKGHMRGGSGEGQKTLVRGLMGQQVEKGRFSTRTDEADRGFSHSLSISLDHLPQQGVVGDGRESLIFELPERHKNSLKRLRLVRRSLF